jgi:hypothetical protein
VRRARTTQGLRWHLLRTEAPHDVRASCACLPATVHYRPVLAFTVNLISTGMRPSAWLGVEVCKDWVRVRCG